MTKGAIPEPASELWLQTAKALDGGDFTFLDEALHDANVSIIDLLDANDAPSNYVEEAFTWACFTGRNDVVVELLDRGVDPAAGIATGMAAFHWAANRGNLETVMLLIERGAPLEQKNMYDGTVLNCTLWSAVHEHKDSHAEIIAALINAGAEIEEGTLEWWIDQEVPSVLTKKRVTKALGGA